MKVYIRNRRELSSKVDYFRDAGVNNLHVISDFDKTLTKAFMYGFVHTSSQIIKQKQYFSDEFLEKTNKLFDHYHPIEKDLSLPLEEKTEKMIEWWEKSSSLFVEYGLNKNIIKDAVKLIQLRDGCYDFIDALNSHDIPLLIFSAGQGDVIEEFFRYRKKLNANLHIVSNFYEYDAEGISRGYDKENMIHIMNKNFSHVKNEDYIKKIKNRETVLLLGDSISDKDMSQGLDYANIIEVGFFNDSLIDFSLDNLMKNLRYYIDKFDVVIANDGDMRYVNDILNSIVS